MGALPGSVVLLASQSSQLWLLLSLSRWVQWAAAMGLLSLQRCCGAESCPKGSVQHPSASSHLPQGTALVLSPTRHRLSLSPREEGTHAMAPLCSGSRCTPGAVLGGRAGSGSSLILCLMFQAGRTRQEMRIKESRRSVETLRDLPTPVRVRLWQGQGCPGAFLGLQRPALLLWPGQVSAEMVQPPCASVSPVKGLCLCAVSCLAMNWVR